MEKNNNKNDLRFGCQIIQMQLDAAKEFSQSDYWKFINDIIRFVTPDITIKDGENNDKK